MITDWRLSPHGRKPLSNAAFSKNCAENAGWRRIAICIHPPQGRQARVYDSCVGFPPTFEQFAAVLAKVFESAIKMKSHSVVVEWPSDASPQYNLTDFGFAKTERTVEDCTCLT